MITSAILLASVFQQTQRPPDMRVVEVKAAGLSVSVPKSWGTNKRDSSMVGSFKVPIPNSKDTGTLEIGYVVNDSVDIGAFQSAAKSVMEVGGNLVERQWAVDIMGSPIALTRYSKDNSTSVRGVYFRNTKAKLVINLSSQTKDFGAVEPQLFRVLESLREVKMEAPKPAVSAEPVEKQIPIMRSLPGSVHNHAQHLPVAQGEAKGTLDLPKGVVGTKLTDNTYSLEVPGVAGTVVVTAHDAAGNPPSLRFQLKAAESSEMFQGAIERSDETSMLLQDKQIRDYIWRTGFKKGSGEKLMTMDCVITQDKPMYLHIFFTSSQPEAFSRSRSTLRKFLDSITLTVK
jgi:hypothetical protein